MRANENPFLTSIHTLFVREHNRICDEIKAANPDWTDEQIYQYARKLVGGQIEAIVYHEWLPTLGVNMPEYSGYSPSINPGIMNVFSTAAYRYGHTTIGTDFVMMDGQGKYLPGGENMELRQLFFNPGFISPSTNGVEGFLAGMSTVHTQEFDCHVIDDLRNFLFGPPGAGGLDLVSLNINRGRDRGLTDYNTVRAEFGMPKISSFNQLSSDPLLNQHFASVYKSVDLIDPWAGMLAEEHMDGSLFGITAQTILKEQFTSLRDGDRFFYEVDPVLSSEEKTFIRNTRLADVIRRNTSIEFIADNIFELQEQSTSSEDFESSVNVSVYPNPAADYISISISDADLGTNLQKVEITDLSGKILLVQDKIEVNNQSNLTLNIGNLPNQNMYVLHAWSTSGHYAGKFLKF
ncbi:MAG: T9SS type A sorting domain-containing protein [Saprospiraceae bacterium]|nr:T9SS type A sorting domain-containing protein [Saprospiraceae bacterium]